ncbi:AcrR family transcriptional regulator [Kibdelosporangium banguiense]|uniref:AcrR family transcriptional regulator n=1 Tax=Kibdelosporangium banguiense TaxID=1365924 RepID=A0ABS4TPX2_9PSEU|nr:TetR/AcrR family transcriptional regulator [Kibdelosporangium banguiense]MBP2326034.1 AcrR family transcriptional regulator [Kibdelosporangium banguiense]
MSAPSLRARVRSEMNQEIKQVARRHLAAEGANLSLRGVARDMGIVASALYRYFPSRDALLTALIIDAYDALGTAATEAEAAVPRDNLRGRWLATCHAARTWALAHPAEYGLLYGNPVPGYSAPQETVPLAAKVVFLLAGVVADGAENLEPLPPVPIPAPVRADLRRTIDQHSGDMPEERLDRVFAAWTHLFGLISFEVFGRLDDVIESRADYFDHHMSLMADQAGIPR